MSPISISSTSPILNLVGDSLLSYLPVGLRYEATVINAALAGQIATIQLAGQQIQIRAEMALSEGQKLLLERVTTSPHTAFKVVTESSEIKPAPDLKVGSQLTAEVVKLLAQNQLLAAVTGTRPHGVPSQMLIDVNHLPQQNFFNGQKLILTVREQQPLAISIRPDMPSTIAQIIRQVLPNIGMQPTQLTALPAMLTDTQLTALQQPIAQFLSIVSPLTQLRIPTQLQQALQNSGVFMEQRLINQQPVTQDLKAQLLTLSSVIQAQINQSTHAQQQLLALPEEVQQALTRWLAAPHRAQLSAQLFQVLNNASLSPTQLIMQLLLEPLKMPNMNIAASSLSMQRPVVSSESVPASVARLQILLREVESSLARIQLNQMTMLREPESAQTQQVWLMEIPIKDKQHLHWMQLQIEQQRAKKSPAGADHWQVTLKLETHSLGLIEARIGLKEAQVNISLITESPEIADFLQADLDWLHKKLQDLQLNIQQLHCRCGPIAWFIPTSSSDDSADYLDVRV